MKYVKFNFRNKSLCSKSIRFIRSELVTRNISKLVQSLNQVLNSKLAPTSMLPLTSKLVLTSMLTPSSKKVQIQRCTNFKDGTLVQSSKRIPISRLVFNNFHDGTNSNAGTDIKDGTNQRWYQLQRR